MLIATSNFRVLRRPLESAQSELVQVKGRAIDIAHPRKGRLPSINLAHPFDSVVLVLIDQATMNPYEIWEVRRDRVESLLTKPGSKARNERGALESDSKLILIARAVG